MQGKSHGSPSSRAQSYAKWDKGSFAKVVLWGIKFQLYHLEVDSKSGQGAGGREWMEWSHSPSHETASCGNASQQQPAHLRKEGLGLEGL